ncbi:MAG: protein-disulfide reductase DsbD domain-containing protein [Pseudomonadota bacterium]
MIRLLLSLCLALMALPVTAQSREPFADPISARIIPGWDLPDGRHVAGLELVLKPGWKTYWRSPGDAGIPPEFDWSRARNVGAVQVDWPTPEIHIQNGLRSIGYDGRVVIPLTVTPRRSGAIRLRGRMHLGVCADVCMPHAIDLDGALPRGNGTPVPAVASALAALPYSAEEAGVRAATCRLRPTDRGVMLEARVALPRTGRGEIAVIEPNVADVWTSEARVHRADGWLIAVSELVHNRGKPFAIDRSDVVITVLGGQFAVEIEGCTAG